MKKTVIAKKWLFKRGKVKERIKRTLHFFSTSFNLPITIIE